jgi:hypothetical protein
MDYNAVLCVVLSCGLVQSSLWIGFYLQTGAAKIQYSEFYGFIIGDQKD